MTAGAPGARRLFEDWQLCAAAPGQHASPQAVDADPRADWLAAPLGTIANMLRAVDRWSLDLPSPRLDAHDWWLRTRCELTESDLRQLGDLRLEGLGGLVDLWINGQHALRSENMFVAHRVHWQPLLRPGHNLLHMRVESLDEALTVRRARPRWRAPMMEHQQLRWFRQSPLGRTPGWSPPAPPLGVWRRMTVEPDEDRPPSCEVHVVLGSDGVGVVTVEVACDPSAPPPESIEFELARGEGRHAVALQSDPTTPGRWQGCLRIGGPELWWPHTHGEPALYGATLRWTTAPGVHPSVRRLPSVGFRSIELDRSDEGFGLVVNGTAVFCRGACWMPLNIVSLRSEADDYRAAISQARTAGMNMLRVSGTTVYEDEAFFEACDQQGILVWQDFMFANMDYPGDDPPFVASVCEEVEQQMRRWRAHPCLAVLCGNSEGEQQAAMWGAPRGQWSPPLFHDVIRERAARLLPGVPYWPSSAHGGAFPHQSSKGTSSYYGVGAYLRTQGDVRRAGVRFATECLGFSNVPELSTILRMPQGPLLRAHHPQWKARSPRDLGAGWDFDDVRDHYLSELFGVDAMRCRYVDHERYLALSRVVTGELMADAFAEWRRPGSSCRGAMVWFLRDLWAGAGWGLVDEQGVAKPCWHFLRRALQPTVLSMTDEGGNGLFLHVVHEPASPLEAELEVTLFGPSDARVDTARQAIRVGPRGHHCLALASLFDGFHDLSYSYRFGPPAVTLVHARLRAADGALLTEAFHFPAGRPAVAGHRMPLSSVALRRLASGELIVRLDADGWVQSVHIELEGYALSDNYFHMAPGTCREISAQGLGDGMPGRGWVRPLNSTHAMALRLDE
jgi:beta-mannosidase